MLYLWPQIRIARPRDCSGLSTGPNRIAVFGASGGAGDRKALIVLTNDMLEERARSEFSTELESEIRAAIIEDGRLLVAGNTGSSQVATGSVVRPSDAFIGSVQIQTGTFDMISRFGGDRRDSITSLLKIDGSIYVSGVLDGPITHTADTDSSLGFQNWFLGKLKL